MLIYSRKAIANEAAVASFRESSCFPDHETLNTDCKDAAAESFVQRFKEYLQASGKNDAVVAYHTDFITKFGPLLMIFHDCVRQGDAKTCEACWISCLIMFCALNKKNYKDEAISHIANFIALWPKPIHEMFRRNMSISLKGRKEHNLALDEFVETVMVRPLKIFSKHHTTLSMMKKINLNIELLTHIKELLKK